eukprot:GHVU01228623.1.p3 GENE.GHVU01228623.1~~GHVU01228623.1.p3  ORF type:complete len:189 (+),score=80.50 GHVU01228623.1:1363-1929(+)
MEILQSQLAQLEAGNKEKEDLEHMLNELHREEAEKKMRMLDEQRMREAIKNKADMLRAHREHLAAKADAKQKEAEENERIKEDFLKELATRDRLEQLNQQKRRLMAHNHRKEAEEFLAARKRRDAEAQEAELQEQAKVLAEEEERARILREEKKKLLEEYGDELKDFLPPDTLKLMRELDVDLRSDAN